MIMKFVLAPDSFKGGCSAIEVATAMKTGLSRVFPEAEYDLVPMADGGEGTVQSLVDATHGEMITVSVTGPLGNKVMASYGLLGDGTTAAIEMAQASGIQYVNEATHNPMITTTYGTGELIMDALNHGAQKIILGIGGSATNDGGAGMAQAIGVHLRDIEGNELAPGGGQLDNLATIDIRHVDPRIPKTKILIASDVTNPLVGETGASVIFGPQKGATSEMVKRLDANLVRYAAIIKHDLGKNIAHAPGAGAAGGLGAGLMAFTNSQMKKGIDLVIEYTHLKERVQDADFVFTGEGGIDSQTQYGKTPFGVALAAKSVAPTAPVIVLSGNIGDGLSILYRPDAIDAIFPTATAAKSLAKAIADAASDIELVSENIGRLIAAIQRSKQN